jgi:hypothetical protein
MSYRPPHIDADSIMVGAPHPATIPEDELLAQCDIRTGRVSGPGGTHRNTTDTAVHIVHRPTGLEGQATERRHQGQNRRMALRRLRLRLAIRARTPTSRDGHQPSDLWRKRRQGSQMPINPDHADYPALLAEALDVVVARRFDVAGAAGVLGLSMSQLSRLIRHERHAFARINAGREAVGLRPLRS